MGDAKNKSEAALSRLMGARSIKSFESLDMRTLAGEIAAGGEAAIPAMLKGMQYATPRQKKVLIAALGMTKSPKALPMLLRSTRDRDEENCMLAAGFLSSNISPRDWRDLKLLERAIPHAWKRDVRLALNAICKDWDEQINGKKSPVPRQLRKRGTPPILRTWGRQRARAFA